MTVLTKLGAGAVCELPAACLAFRSSRVDSLSQRGFANNPVRRSRTSSNNSTTATHSNHGAMTIKRGLRGNYHFNAIQTWAIDDKGEAANAYA